MIDNNQVDFYTIEGDTYSIRFNSFNCGIDVSAMDNFIEIDDGDYSRYYINPKAVADFKSQKSRNNLHKVAITFHSKRTLTIVMDDECYIKFKFEVISADV